ncbi:MAG: FAD-binding oxidoreductase [Gemmatimonadales bacterium]
MSDRAAGQCHFPPPGFRGVYRADPSARAVYSEAAGIARIVPAAVAVPVDADDVATLVKWANESSLSIVPRGSGTSMGGGAVGPGVIVDLSRMNQIGEIDADHKTVWVGPGAIRGEVNAAAESMGLRFPVDPSSGNYCTVGGMVSTNAAGAHTLGFGSTRRWVMALDCVFDDGSRGVVERGQSLPEGCPAVERFIDHASERLLSEGMRLDASHPGIAKDSSGYGVHRFAESGELVDLLVGSEGTLGLIVGVKLALIDAAPATTGILGAFSSLEDAVTAAGAARASGAVACELLDRTFLDVAAMGGAHSPVSVLDSIPPETEAVLLAEVEGDTVQAANLSASELAQSFEESGATAVRLASGPADQHEIWELRHAASPILNKLDPALKSMQFIEDGAVPPEHLARYVRGVRAALDKHGVRGVIFGHAGDAHMHVNPLIDVSKPDWRNTVLGLLDDVVELTASLHGTLTGEHGDGRLRTPLMDRVWSAEARELFALVKNAFDPKGILNPGVKVPVENQKPLGDIKYDPGLAPLPDDARRALDLVTDNRVYSELRLSLVPVAGQK